MSCTYRLLEASLVRKESSCSKCSSWVVSIRVGRDRANGSCGRQRSGGCDEWVKSTGVRDPVPIALKRPLHRPVSGIKAEAETAMAAMVSFVDRVEIISQGTQAPGRALVEIAQHDFSWLRREVPRC